MFLPSFSQHVHHHFPPSRLIFPSFFPTFFVWIRENHNFPRVFPPFFPAKIPPRLIPMDGCPGWVSDAAQLLEPTERRKLNALCEQMRPHNVEDHGDVTMSGWRWLGLCRKKVEIPRDHVFLNGFKAKKYGKNGYNCITMVRTMMISFISRNISSRTIVTFIETLVRSCKCQ